MKNHNEKQSNPIIFNLTENMRNLGIKELILDDKDFITTWSNGGQICLGFHWKTVSLEDIIKKIEKRLRKEVEDIADDQTIHLAVRDIEDQLIKRRDEIYNLNTTTSPQENSHSEFKSKFLEDVSKIREQFEKSSNPCKEWQQEVKKKYENLKSVANRTFPDSWQLLQFCISVKSIQNIYGNDIPFIGFILYKPSSLKSTIIDLFQKYPSALYADDITKNSFLSHYSTISEEQLQNNDLIPKMKDKLLLTSEIAPIINANEDDLRKILGIITRLVDGKGYQSHSGTHGHRGYPPMMFTWIGAGIEIPSKMWNMLSQLGFKLYFFRPTFKKKTVDDLKKIAKDDNLSEKKQQLENALLDYLKVFDAAPQTDEIVLDESGIPKIKWHKAKDEDSTIRCISNVANLLASLRGTVNTSYSKTRKSTKINNDGNNVANENTNNTSTHAEFIQTEQIDYEIEPSVTEDPSRAVIQLRKLALANAISQGRNYLTKDDANLIIRVCFSTTKIYRAKILKMLLENNGELTASQISNGLDISKPHAHQTMQEFHALKIAQVSTISSYERSERKMKLNDEFSWFLSDEFKQLYKPVIALTPSDISRQTVCCNMNSQYVQIIRKNLSNNYNHYPRVCDADNNNCHTSKVNSNHESNKKNNLLQSEDNIDKNAKKNKEDIGNEPKLSDNKTQIDYKNELLDGYKLKENNNLSYIENQKNSSSLRDQKCFTHVTMSHENRHTENDSEQNKKHNTPKEVVDDILKIIKDEHGQIALNYVLQLACEKSSNAKEFFKDEKLTSRDSRKVRNVFVEINRHPNIQVVKKKPQLVVRWIESGC